MKFISFSPVLPYDSINHAGGKTYNFYVNFLSNQKNIKFKAVCFSNKKEYIKHKNVINKTVEVIFTSGTLISSIQHYLYDKVLFSRTTKGRDISIYKLKKIIKYLKKEERKSFLPDIIQLEWTNFVLYAPYIKNRFPSIKIIASEHDVSYLHFQRNIDYSEDKVNAEFLYKKRKEDELHCLDMCDIIMPHNIKDKNLLISDGIKENKIFVLTPYYHDMSTIIRNSDESFDILFWGAMNRPENYESAIWFIDNVMPLLEDTKCRFIVAGNKPPEVLKNKASAKVIITGFVEDETQLFSKSMCFVSPLLNGAGIKIKVLEALSSGIPVISNEIGIEGIPVSDGVNYLKASSPKEYDDAIRKLLSDISFRNSIGENGKHLVIQNFNMITGRNKYISMLQKFENNKDLV